MPFGGGMRLTMASRTSGTPCPVLALMRHGVGGVEADRAFDHLLGARNVGAGQIDLVDDGNDFEAVIDGEIGVGQGLGFDALGGIHDQQRAFAGGQRARRLRRKNRRGRECR